MQTCSFLSSHLPQEQKVKLERWITLTATTARRVRYWALTPGPLHELPYLTSPQVSDVGMIPLLFSYLSSEAQEVTHPAGGGQATKQGD